MSDEFWFWLTVYGTVGIVFSAVCASSSQFLTAFHSSHRAQTGRDPGWVMCTMVALGLMAFWPVGLTFGLVVLLAGGRR